MKFNQDKKTVFLDPHVEMVVSDEKLNIILSPSLYWVKKIKLPVKYIREAKKLLVSLFEDLLPEGNYSYSVYKVPSEDGYFYIFAYEDKVILDLLASQGVGVNNISSIRFAQSELDKIEGAVKINEKQSIYVKDSVVTLVPCCWIEESGSLNLENIILSKHKITLEQFGHIVDSSSLNKIAIILVVFIILTLSELFLVKSNVQKTQNQTQELFSKYDLKQTMFQNKALLKKYRTIHTTQTKFRKEMAKSFKLKDVKSITYKNKVLKVSS